MDFGKNISFFGGFSLILSVSLIFLHNYTDFVLFLHDYAEIKRFLSISCISATITTNFPSSWQRDCPRLLFAPAAVLIFHEIRPAPYVLRAAAQVATILFFTKILI